MAVLFRTTQFPAGGDFGDARFQIAIVTKFYHGLSGDFAYQNLSSYYPDLFFKLAAYCAHIFGIHPHEILKPASIATVFDGAVPGSK